MMDFPVCGTCGRLIGANEKSIELTLGPMRYQACGDFSVTGEPKFYHDKCGINIEDLERKNDE